MSESINRDEWLKALEDAGIPQLEDDADAVTIAEFAAMFSLTRNTAATRLKTLEEAGKARRTTKRWRASDGRRVTRCTAYRLIP